MKRPPEVIKTTPGGRFYYFILSALILYQSNPYLLKDTFYYPRQHARVIGENKDVLSRRTRERRRGGQIVPSGNPNIGG